MEKSKLVLWRRKIRKEIKNHPFKTWEDTPQFCAGDFAFTVEERKLFEWWKNENQG